MPTKLPPRIDFHSHMLPPAYRQACIENGHGNPDGMPYLPEWSPEAHIQLMDDHNITKSILSVSSPGTHLVFNDNVLAARVTRGTNSYAADLRRRMPERFGYFASLPIPDVETCLNEIKLAASEGCDGFSVLTNGHGVYPGDPLLDPVFDELNRRQAIVFFHPTTPLCPCNLQAAAAGQQPQKATPFDGKFPNPMLEFLFDTARVMTNLFMSGTFQRCPDLQFIFAHCGGAIPPLLPRIAGFSSLVPGPWVGMSDDEAAEILRNQVWFDVAGFSFPTQIEVLMQGCGVPHTKLLYGSDYPFTRAGGVAMLVERMDGAVRNIFTQGEIEDLYHKNGERLLSMPKITM